MKVYSVPDMEPHNRVQMLRELRLHASLDHPNIVNFYAAFMVRARVTQQQPAWLHRLQQAISHPNSYFTCTYDPCNMCVPSLVRI